MSKNAQIDWDHLRVFLTLARTQRVAAAARLLQVEHTTVSRRIGALEKQLGAAVFYRTAAGYLLTPVGQSIITNAEAMERAAVTLGARAREHVGKPAGRVRLAIAPEFASEWLAPLLPKFRAQYPEIELQILVGTRTLDLSRGEAELALHTPRPRQVGLVTSRVAHTSVALFASKTFVGRRELRIRDAESANGIPLMTYTPQLFVLQNEAWFQSVLASAKIVLMTNGTHTLLAAARAHAGVAVLPLFVTRNYDDLVRVSENVGEQDVWLTTHPEFRRDPKVRATADFLKEAARGPTGLI